MTHKANPKDFALDTQLVDLGRDPQRDQGAVNPPVYRTSTVLFNNYEELKKYEEGETLRYRGYGRYGSPNTDGLEEALAVLEGADHAMVTSTGLSAISTTMLGLLSAGDHVLVPDSIYGSARSFIDNELVRYGIDCEYYDPVVGAGIEKHMKKNTRMVYCESPGSLTFEMQDIPAIAKVAHAHSALVVGDNTWATPLLQRPFALGMDVSIHSATKYIGGHSDLLMGVILCKEPLYKRLRTAHRSLGPSTNGDNAYLAIRGLRTIAIRLQRHYANALEVAQWIKTQPEVERVLYPALPEDPGHAIWKRDMTGASGLFGVVLKGNPSPTALSAMLDDLEHFGMGYSWGGFESLVIAYQPARQRVVTKWGKDTTLLRLNIGLEDPKDLIADLDAGFTRLRTALKKSA